MDFSSQESIKEVTCPICQELLREPMSLDCGHSFCEECITAYSESGSPQDLECCCPVCQSRYQPWNLQFNWQLAERVNKFRDVDMNSHQPRKSDLFEHHVENDQISYKEEEEAFSGLCVQEQQGHQMSPKEEVVKECQYRMQTQRERIVQGFEEMRDILDKEEQRELQKLEEDEMNVLHDLTAAVDQVVQQKQYLSELVSDLQYYMSESSVDTLQGVINVLTRSKIWTLKKPKIIPKKLKSAFQVPDLNGMLQKFKELTEIQSYWGK
ncbi:hypothetical protein HJG60_019506 [Phyllostomus discolor]|uniref:RING-type domain-containing protein n=1 Tax=Phyllostomus discolor TaxID=89673 RepID=A0A834A9C0_9CHIR|nr:hypothetical protein HJG60_019506 [Phyllostomus discolor]